MDVSTSPASLIEKLHALAPSLESEEHKDAAAKEAIQLSKQLTAGLESPASRAVELAFVPFLPAAARIAINLDLFKLIAKNDEPIALGQLASDSGGEELLIARTLRLLSTIGFVTEVAEQTWQPNAVTHVMATDELAAAHRMIGEMIVQAAQMAPKYFKKHGQKCPTDLHDGLMQFAFDTKMSTFELFSSMPEVLADFNLAMGNVMGSRNLWIDWFPVQERLIDGKSAQTPLLVDIGAGKGHDLLAFHKQHPCAGRLVLQDLPAVTENLKGLDPALEVVAYDFFTEQPIQGARAYFMHHILHDWPDDKCLEILARVRRAMTPGYSKLLLNEMILPAKGAAQFQATMDVVMMAFNAGMERTEQQWSHLLDKAGLAVVKFWQPMQEDADGIVEAMVKV